MWTRVAGTIGFGLLAIAAVSGTLAASHTAGAVEYQELQVDPIEQAEFEAELVEFLAANPKPESRDFQSDPLGRSQYWIAVADWWERVPWTAVAGQWGCTAGTVGVTFNPPDKEGVSTAGYGGMIDCPSSYASGEIARMTEPVPRADVALDPSSEEKP